ncbi:uncharacterized protein PV06_09913 [Exophiala oligosperma]|uniref:Uncharacterized protein n=1 Tax=Exophiala oligosperma TaxID=215243 RepID=A0A0D2D6F1_9EURO|nr:uncharacterized protein PV06_09913 [Exophiala oligosperma]KIW37935.1 hypothetical protein PV06_09913 [Exophiala oligosperma]
MEEPEASSVSNATPTQLPTIENDVQDENRAAEPAPMKPKRHRGRQAKDPLGQTVQFKCNKVEDLEEQLRNYLANPTGEHAHTTLAFSFPVTTAFLIALREKKGNRPLHDKTPYSYSHFNKTAVTVIDALQNIQDPKEQMFTQKGISKTLVDAVQEADGYHYSFHNHWISREDQASRFSYFCNDSVLNKGRAASEGLSKVKAGIVGKKQVWECEGVLAIKFSLTKMSLELHYKHIPLHPTFDERAPLPRAGSKRRKLMEIFHPEKLEHLSRGRPKTYRPRAKNGRPQDQNIPEPLPQPANENETATEGGRDHSLQPLFDFLGSAEQSVGASPGSVGDRAEHDAETTPTTTTTPQADNCNDAGIVATSGEVEVASSSQGRFPGMVPGVMSGVEDINRGRISGDSNKKKRKKNAPASANTELEALKAKLLEAEQKIQYLEAERNRAAAPLTWIRSSHSPSTLFPDSAAPPPPQQPQYPQGLPPHSLHQWQSQPNSSDLSATPQSDSFPHRSLPPQNPEPTGPSPSYDPPPPPTLRTHPDNIPFYGFVPVIRNPNDPPPPRRLEPKLLPAGQLPIQGESSPPQFHVATQTSMAEQSRSG